MLNVFPSSNDELPSARARKPFAKLCKHKTNYAKLLKCTSRYTQVHKLHQGTWKCIKVLKSAINYIQGYKSKLICKKTTKKVKKIEEEKTLISV